MFFVHAPSAAGVHAADGVGAGPCHLLPGSGGANEQASRDVLVDWLGFGNDAGENSAKKRLAFCALGGGDRRIGAVQQYRWR